MKSSEKVELDATPADAAAAALAADPYVVLDELMCVVEALCPEWPERPAFRAGLQFKL